MNRNPLFHLHHIGWALLPALFLASCSQEELDGAQDEPLLPGQYPLELTAGGLEAAPARTPYRYGLDEANRTVTLPTVWTKEKLAEYDIIGATKTI